MADHIQLNSGTGGDTVMADDISGVKVQGVKVVLGADNTNSGYVSSANPLPVSVTGGVTLPTGAATETTLAALNAKVTACNTGAVAVSSSVLPTGAATETTLASLNTKVTAVNTGAVVVSSSALPAGAATAANQQTDALTNTQLRATPVPVSGTVTATAGANLNTSALALEAGGNLAAQTTALQLIDNAVSGAGFNITQFAGTGAATGSGNATGALRVELPTNGTGVLATLTTLTGGAVASGAADSGNPHKVGMVAFAPDGTVPGTAVAEGNRVTMKGDLDGRLFINNRHPRSLKVHLDGSSAYTDQAVVAAPGSGLQTIITNIIASTGAATALNFFLEEGSTKIFGPIYLEAVAGRGFCSGPINLPITVNTAVTLTSSAAIAQSFNFEYYIQAV